MPSPKRSLARALTRRRPPEEFRATPFPLRAPITVRVATQPSHTVDGSMAALLTGLLLEGARAERQGASLRFRLSPFRRPLRWFGDPLLFVTGGVITVSHSGAETPLTGWVSFTD